MTISSAKKLAAHEHTDESQSIHDFNALLALFRDDPTFATFSFKRGDISTCDLGTPEVVMRFINYDRWQNLTSMNISYPAEDNARFLAILTGTEEQLCLNEPYITKNELQTLCLPISRKNLIQQIQNIAGIEEQIIHSEYIHQQVSDVNTFINSVLGTTKSMNSVRNPLQLLSLILYQGRKLCNADGGAIYTVEWKDNLSKEGRIRFNQMQLYSARSKAVRGPLEFSIDTNTIIGKAILSEHSIAVQDPLQKPECLDPVLLHYAQTLKEETGYDIRSILAVPMFDIGNRVIGVILLLNRKKKDVIELRPSNDFKNDTIDFSDRDIDSIEIIARQAGIALENALLTEERDKLFEGFVHAAVSAIEQRDPTTSGHSQRVAKLTVETASVLNKFSTGIFKNVKFSHDELKELEYASLLHDFGKIGVRQEVLVKAKKLYPWQEELVIERFNHAKSSAEREFLRSLIDYLGQSDKFPPWFTKETLSKARDDKLTDLVKFLDFIFKCNEPTVLEQGGFEMLKDIASQNFDNAAGSKVPLISEAELKALSISRGSLTQQEFNEIQSHVNHTFRFLRNIPWGTKFAAIPEIAAKHHEKLDGSGYPNSCPQKDIPVQTRIMTISDIFDALTASDRPYKKAVPIDKALEIIEMEVKGGKCDPDLFKVFVDAKIYECVLPQPSK